MLVTQVVSSAPSLDVCPWGKCQVQVIQKIRSDLLCIWCVCNMLVITRLSRSMYATWCNIIVKNNQDDSMPNHPTTHPWGVSSHLPESLGYLVLCLCLSVIWDCCLLRNKQLYLRLDPPCWKPRSCPFLKVVKSFDRVLMTHSDANPVWNMIDACTCFFLYWDACANSQLVELIYGLRKDKSTAFWIPN